MLNEILKNARKQKKLTQTELANIVGVKPAEVSQYESGKRTPRFNVLIKILDTLDISADVALGREQSVVSEDNSYSIRVSKKDLNIISAIKKYPELYKILYENPERSSKVLNSNLSKIFPKE